MANVNTERDRQITVECLQGKTLKELAIKNGISASRIAYIVLGNCRRHYSDTKRWHLTIKEARQDADKIIERIKALGLPMGPTTGPKCSFRQLPKQNTRVENGVVRFGDDWCGVFIRGDSAFQFAISLHAVLHGNQNDLPANLGLLDTEPFHKAILTSFLKLLESSNETNIDKMAYEGTEGSWMP